MKRLVVFLMLLALPIRTVLAVSGFGCAVMPMQMPQAGGADRAPCPMHVVDGMQIAVPIEAPMDSEAPMENVPTSCPSCAAACCAAFAPVPPKVVGISRSSEHIVGVVETPFASAVRHALERPPRIA